MCLNGGRDGERQLAHNRVRPGSGVLDRAELMLAMIRPFLDAE
jgi:hypothetical protein